MNNEFWRMNSPGGSRRSALKSLASGFGYLAFASLAHQQAARAVASSSADGLTPKPAHFPARAKRVIFLCMNGGPSHIDLFDDKPKLQSMSGQKTAESALKGSAGLMESPFQFAQHGESGQWVSELMPHLATMTDELCFIKSMQTDLPNHSQAFLQMHTGSFQFTRPSLGAWSLYGLGSENENLPGFVTLNPPSDNGGSQNYGSAFLPAVCQATRIGTNQIPGFYAALLGVDSEPGPPLKNIGNQQLTSRQQRRQLDLIRDLNEHKLARDQYNPEIEGAIESFELAFRMQGEIPEVLDLSAESEETLKQYGIGSGLPTDSFGRQCLLARRMVEAGVRFVEITAPAKWDHHFRLKPALQESCLATDQPAAALLKDLKARGLLDDTLVIWAGEFGRTPYAQSGTGRDHNNKGYTLWMAGGGVKRGLSFGATDELGYEAVENPVHIHDWHATILHLLGFDHTRLTFNYAGRDYRLTDVYGKPVHEIMA
ncbi:DUF1501 domain-containing protein [Rubinisphaera margarita]|uniref:DUF1501 domain-containing protein n=1 Tax=Rubinisphaera margarita TaxID=2909586 RepID=UPI001EE7A5E3|nr:DUF1501 domain-containing protein [Rubinisphaera margarita]MCG6158134.1 DUF1501 domain-containing protein [Rubinisphaera margarita]